MKNFRLLAIASGALACVFHVVPSLAQDEQADLETIVITGRNREEDITDVPVSTSVLSDTLIEDAGITDLYDLFEMVPGLHYEEDGDRLAALPSIRGIQANDVAPNRTKVTAFIDGIPVLGSQGSIGFNGFQQVEVYRGPQSAAFGRSTFAGAINYVTRDPGDTFEGSVGLNVSDFGTRTVDLSVGGPITDSLGFLLNYSKEDSGSPDEWHATGDYATNLFGLGQNNYQSDGTEFGSRSGDNVSGKLVFQPDDTLKLSMTFNHVTTDDIGSPSFYLTEEARNACLEQGALFASEGMMAPYLVGEMDCDWDNVRENWINHDVDGWLDANPDYLDYLVDLATNPQDVVIMGMPGEPDTVIPAGPAAAPVTINGTTYSVEEQILLMAQALSIPEDKVGTESERNRFTFQADKLLDNGSAIQFSYMQSDENYLRALATDATFYYDPDYIGIVDDGNPTTFIDNARGPEILWGAQPNSATYGADPAGTAWYAPRGMGYPNYATPSIGDIQEQYAELRWVSPAEDRMRFVVGASFYDYNFVEERWGNFDDMGNNPNFTAMLYGAELNGIVDEFLELSGHNTRGNEFLPDNEVIADDATNTAAYFNVGYDLTEKLTLSLEGRYQSDTVGATNLTTDLSEEVTTDKFVPRVALTYNLNENTSYYLQYAQGVNPRGINNAVLTTDTLRVLNNGVELGLIPFTAALNEDNYNNDDFTAVPDGIVDAYDNTTSTWYTDGTRTTQLTGNVYDSGFDRQDFTTYKEEQINQIEFGFKGNALDGRLTYAGAVYSIDWQDQLQNGSIDLDSPCAENGDAGNFIGAFGGQTLDACEYEGQQYFWVGGTQGATLNASLNFGDVKIEGAEIEGNYRISNNWDIRAQASVMKAKYDDFCDIQAYNDIQLDPNDAVDAAYLDAFNISIREPGDGDTQTSTCYVTNGNEVARQPSFSASVSPSFNMDIGSMRFNARLDVRHEGKQWDNSINFNSYPAVTTANLSLGLSGDAWSATLYVNNLTDENAPTQIRGGGDAARAMGLSGQDLTYSFTGALGETVQGSDITRDNFNFQPRIPRTVGVRASYRF